MMQRVLIELFVFSILLFVGWIGFQIKPKEFDRRVFTNLQHYRKRYVKDAGAPDAQTSLVTGIAQCHIKGIWMMERFAIYYKEDEGFYRYTEVTWFGIPMTSGYDKKLWGATT